MPDGFIEKKICRVFRVSPWVAGVGKRPRWPVRAWCWLRGYRPGCEHRYGIRVARQACLRPCVASSTTRIPQMAECEHQWVWTNSIIWHAGRVEWDWRCKRCHKVEARPASPTVSDPATGGVVAPDAFTINEAHGFDGTPDA